MDLSAALATDFATNAIASQIPDIAKARGVEVTPEGAKAIARTLASPSDVKLDRYGHPTLSTIGGESIGDVISQAIGHPANASHVRKATEAELTPVQKIAANLRAQREAMGSMRGRGIIGRQA